MARTFISFLGTSDYLECRYTLDNTTGEIVKYVQEDLVQRCCRDWNPDDEIRIFTTHEAVDKNWKDNGHIDRHTGKAIPSSGLETRLGLLGGNARLRRINIPKGDSEAEIWAIFHQVYSTLRRNEEIVIDITHGFRSLPVLLMTLMGYSRLLKNISVAGIYYGAFEILGPVSKVKEMAADRRIAPVFDLTSFEQIVEWTEATQSFVRNGAAKDLERLATQQINPVLKESRGADPAAKSMGQIVKGIESICRNILMNRGAEIIHYDYGQLKSQFQSLDQDDIFIKPLVPLFSEIEKKIDAFAKDDIHNGFRAVDWCVAHGMIQQAITMLQENIVTLVLAEDGQAWGVEKNRTAVSKAMKIVSQSITVREGDVVAHEPSLPLIETLQQNPFVLKLFRPFEKLRSLRNDVNHGGYNEEANNRAKSGRSIQDKFQRCYKEIQEILSEN